MSETKNINTESHSDSLSNAQFFKWFFLVNLGVVLTTVWFLDSFALIFPIVGIGGAFLALVFSRWLAIRAHKIKLIDAHNPTSDMEHDLQEMVAELAKRAGLPSTPEVGIYESPDMNAFATGRAPSAALIAFSSGILTKLPPDQLRAVAAHEIAHIANRDMLAMVLLQGVVNAIVIAVTFPIDFLRFGNLLSEDYSTMSQFIMWLTKTVVAVVLTFIGSLFVKAFSRHREYRADAFAARLVGTDQMTGALQALSMDTEEAPREQFAYAAFKIKGGWSLGELLSTHPTIEKRIAALSSGQST